MRLLLDFTRALRADERVVPLAFLEGKSRDYHLRGHGQSGVNVVTFEWDEELFSLLDKLRSHTDKGVDEMAARIGSRLAAFLAGPVWTRAAPQIAERGKSDLTVVTVRSDASELYVLPWELLSVERVRHLGHLSKVLIRYELPGRATEPPLAGLSRTKRGRVVFAWSAAGGKVDAAEHVKLLKGALEASRGAFEPDPDPALDVIENASCAAIAACLQRAAEAREPVAVLHLLCHGGVDENGTFGLLLSNDARSGAPDLVTPSRLEGLLMDYAGLVRLVVVSACDGGNAVVGDALGSVAHAIHGAGFPAVIASRFPLSYPGARAFAGALYDRLLRDLTPLEEAFLAARRTLRQELSSTYDWASLQLYAREADGDATQVFNVRPYRGLSPFAPEHTRFFFGRDAEVAEVVRELDALVEKKKPRFMVVAGASGTGKSSMVLAGVVPKLAARDGVAHLVVRPGASPREAARTVEARRATLAPGEALLVVVDQFEEVFTYAHEGDPGAGAELARALWAWASEPGAGLRVIATLRLDFLGRCEGIVLDEATGMKFDRVALDHTHQVLVAQMDPAQLREAIERPAAAVGLALEAGLARRIVQDVAAEPGALPLMAHALDLLWRERQGATLTQAAYEALGAVQGALDRHAEAVLAALADDADRRAARRLLVRMVHPGGDTASDTRRRCAADALRPKDPAEHERFERVLSRLVSARLVVTGDGGTVEIAHEALIRTWSSLREWINDERATLVQIAQVNAWVAEWEANRDALLAGSRLGYAEEVARGRPDDLADAAHALIAASRAEQDRRENALKDALLRARDNSRMSVAREAAVDAATKIALLREVERPDRALRWEEVAREALARPDVAQAVFEHPGGVTAAAFSRDGAWVVTASDDGTARVWRADGAGEPVVLWGHEGAVCSAGFSPDGARVVTASDDGTARVWRADGADEPVVLRGHEDRVISAEFSPDGTRVVTASYDGTARVWRADGTGAPVALRGHQESVRAASFSPDGTRVITASGDKTARVWRADGAGEPVVLRGHEGPVWSAAFSPDGARLVTASSDGTARVWRADGTGEAVVLRVPGSELSAPLNATFSPDGSQVLTVFVAKSYVWRADGAGDPVTLHQPGYCTFAANFSPDGTRVVVGSGDQIAYIYRADGTGLPVALRGHAGGVLSVEFSRDGSRVLTLSDDRTVRVWRVDGTGEPVILGGSEDEVSSATFTSDGTHVFTVSNDGTGRMRRADGTGEAVVQGAPEGEYISTHYSPDGAKAATVSEDGTVRVWRADGAGDPVVLRGHTHRVSSVAFSPDATRVVTASWDHTARVWRTDGAGDPVVLRGHEGPVFSAIFSPDGEGVITASDDKTARVWRADGTGVPVVLLGHEDWVYAVTFSPDGEHVATASKDGTARVWRADGRGEAVALRGHDLSLGAVAFSPDGRHVITGAGDGTARIWRADGAGEPAVLRGHTAGVPSVAFSPDGMHVLTVSDDGTARVWRRELTETLWDATTYCISVRRRMALLGESEEEATAAYARSREAVARHHAQREQSRTGAPNHAAPPPPFPFARWLGQRAREPSTASTPPPVASDAPRRPRWRLAAFALIVTFALIAGGYAFTHRPPTPRSTPTRPAARPTPPPTAPAARPAPPPPAPAPAPDASVTPAIAPTADLAPSDPPAPLRRQRSHHRAEPPSTRRTRSHRRALETRTDE